MPETSTPQTAPAVPGEYTRAEVLKAVGISDAQLKAIERDHPRARPFGVRGGVAVYRPATVAFVLVLVQRDQSPGASPALVALIVVVGLALASMSGCDDRSLVTTVDAPPPTPPAPQVEPGDGLVHPQEGTWLLGDSAPAAPTATQPSHVTIRPDGGVDVAGGASVEIIDRRRHHTTGPTTAHNSTAKATGGSAIANGPDVKVDQVREPSRVGLDGVNADGIGGGGSRGEAGGSATTSTASGNREVMVLYALGGLAILGGGLLAGLWSRFIAGICLALAGAVCIGLGVAAKESPGLMVAGLALLGVAALIAVVIEARASSRARKALDAVTTGIAWREETNPVEAKAVKDEIAAAAGTDLPTVRDEVRKAKARRGVA